jgi:hypothetical protein
VDDIGDVNPPTVISTAGYSSLSVNLKSTDTTPLVYDIVSARAGSVTLNVKNAGPRALFFDGGFTIGGNLTVNGGNGGLTVTESTNAMLVSGNATFNGGSSADTLDLSAVGGTTIGGKLTLSKFNTLSTNSGDAIGGNLSFNDAGEGTMDVLLLTDTHVGGNLNYLGGTTSDTIVLGGTMTSVDGNVAVNFGGQLALDASVLVQSAGPSNVIAGKVSVTGDSLGSDVVILGGVVDGNINLNMGGGTNTAIVSGMFMGSSMKFTSGAGMDTLVYTPLIGSAAASLKAIMGAGSDTISFGVGTAPPSSAYLDFGAGADTLIGSIAFPATILNLP